MTSTTSKMTEDDTYERLRRPSIYQMASLITDFCIKTKQQHLPRTNEDLLDILAVNGWTLEDFESEVAEIEKRAGI